MHLGVCPVIRNLLKVPGFLAFFRIFVFSYSCILQIYDTPAFHTVSTEYHGCVKIVVAGDEEDRDETSRYETHIEATTKSTAI